MANGCCNNALCADRETQLRLARLREELLTNFNSLLLDRIRFLEQTIHQLSSSTLLLPSVPIAATTTNPNTVPIQATTDRLSAPSMLRRSSSTTAYFLQSPLTPDSSGNGAGARSCPSSVDLSTDDNRRTRFFSSKKTTRSQTRTSSDSHNNYLSIPMNAKLSMLTNDLASNNNVNEKGRLESRRFACDVDDNEVRAFKAMIYMEQARKQHARPLTRLRQALGMSSNSTTGNQPFQNSKKHSNA